MAEKLLISREPGFDFVIKRQRRKTIALHVLPDASVEVRAPKWVAKAELLRFVEQRSSWVLEQRQQRLSKLALKPSYRDGHRHPYLGRHYPLSVTAAGRAAACFKEDVLLLKVVDPNNEEQVKKALESWYRKQAIDIFEQRMFACFDQFPDWFQTKYRVPEITVRKMRRRWGSCSSKGDVTLNLALIKMPVECIDYVIMHELTHLEIFHHGKAFYGLLSSVLPSWREAELLIEKLAAE